MQKFALSARAYSKILKVARTIADLEGSQISNLTTLQKQFSIEASKD